MRAFVQTSLRVHMLRVGRGDILARETFFVARPYATITERIAVEALIVDNVTTASDDVFSTHTKAHLTYSPPRIDLHILRCSCNARSERNQSPLAPNNLRSHCIERCMGL